MTQTAGKKPKKLCQGYNMGACPGHDGGACPANANLRHLCHWCGQAHMGTKCKHTGGKRDKGNGKGNGKGGKQ